MENVFRDPSFKKNLPAALLHLRPGGLRVIGIIKSAPTGYHGDALRPLPISAGYVAETFTTFTSEPMGSLLSLLIEAMKEVNPVVKQ